LFRVPIDWAQRVVDFAIAQLSCSGGLRKTISGIRSHPRSLILVPIESSYATSY